MAHFLCHLGCSHFGALLLDFYFTENSINQAKLKDGRDLIADHKLHTIYAITRSNNYYYAERKLK